MKVLITAGPTQELIDPIRYITNSASGKQGYELAHHMSELGYEVNLVSGPVSIELLPKCKIFYVRSASQMLEVCKSLLPLDIAILTAAVTDWLPEYSISKIKKTKEINAIYNMRLSYNVDILKYISTHNVLRPKLVIGFALESEDILKNAQQKLVNKGCDWIVANDVKVHNVHTMGSDYNQVTLITSNKQECLPIMTKKEIAIYLTNKIKEYFS